MMRCLVTGATGHLGSALVRTLLREGCEIAALVRPGNDISRMEDLRGRITILDQLSMVPAFAPEVVFHVGWHGIGRDTRDSAAQIYENVPYTLAVFRAAAEAGARCWIGLGSQAEYGPVSGVMREDLEPRPATAYAIAKRTVALLTERLCALERMRYVWMRLVATYGPADDERRLIPMIIEALQAGETPALTNGDQFVDYLYVDDAAEALWTAALNERVRGVFNLASGQALRVRELAELIRDVVNPDAALAFGRYDDGAVVDLRADISRFREISGWSPRVSLRDGIARTAQWYAERRTAGASQ